MILGDMGHSGALEIDIWSYAELVISNNLTNAISIQILNFGI